jgi:hypothetical protein
MNGKEVTLSNSIEPTQILQRIKEIHVGPSIALSINVNVDGDSIRFDLHPDQLVEYIGMRIPRAKLVNGIWYRPEGASYRPFPLQHEVRVVATKAKEEKTEC